MCGCSDICSVARCNGCPGTDWNSFSWRFVSPASVGVMTLETLERRFNAVDTIMKYPGVCPCVWVQYLGDSGRDTLGTYNEASVWHDIACASTLSYQRSGERFSWKLYVSRYYWDWGYWETLYGSAYGDGWHWGEWGPGTFGNQCSSGGFSVYGYPGYGYGWGGYAWGYGFDPAYWGIGAGGSTEYTLQGTFNCSGTNRFVRNDAPYASEPAYKPDSWPAYVDISRVSLTGKVVA